MPFVITKPGERNKVPFDVDEIVKSISTIRLDDFPDRLSHLYNAFMFFTLALVLLSTQTFGTRMQCFPEGATPKSWNTMPENYCFVTGTYNTVSSNVSNNSVTALHEERIYYGYYPWTFWILSWMGAMFLIPNQIWSFMLNRSIFNFNYMILKASEARNKTDISKRTEINYIINNVKRYLNCNHTYSENKRKYFVFGYSIPVSYLLIKVLYITNCVVQIYLLNIYFGNGNHFWAFDLLRGYFTSYKSIEYFPTVAVCDLHRLVGYKMQTQKIQCALMVNILNEKIFVFSFLSILLTLFISIFGLIRTILENTVKSSRKATIQQYMGDKVSLKVKASENPYLFGYAEGDSCCSNLNDLKKTCKNFILDNHPSTDINDSIKLKYYDDFVTAGLSYDGIIFLRFLHDYAGASITSEIVHELWIYYVYRRTFEERKISKEYETISNQDY